MSAAEEDLIDYSDEEINTTETKATNGAATKAADTSAAKGSYVGIHSSSFKDLLLSPAIQKAITDCGFEHPSDVQQACIPQAIVGTDVICQAKSGLGKTAVFVISTLQQIDPIEGEAQVIVMCHTRELAFQIKNEYARFTKYMPEVKTAVFYGGVDTKENEKILADKKQYPNIIVGTPGRLNALVRDKKLRLGSVKFFVLDECDKMLDQVDMRRDVQEVFRATPTNKQVMMFSATLSKEVKPICKKFMKNPLELYVDDEKELTLHGLRQYEVVLGEAEKNSQLNDILDQLEYNQVIIFVKSKARAISLGEILRESNFPATEMHAGLSQEERIARYQKLKKWEKRICVATDLFGRGIDLERINLAINYDMPEVRERERDKDVVSETPEAIASCADTYLHRVGRAGRFGTKGIAISFVASDYDAKILSEVKQRQAVSIEPYPKGGEGVNFEQK